MKISEVDMGLTPLVIIVIVCFAFAFWAVAKDEADSFGKNGKPIVTWKKLWFVIHRGIFGYKGQN